MDSGRGFVLGAVAAICLGGCVVSIPSRESQIEATLPTKTMQIVAGQTDRADVQQLLGEPWLASRYWGFELYRASDKNSQIHWALLPVGYGTEDVDGFVLVAYDAAAKVIEYAQGITREHGIFFESDDIPVYAGLKVGDVRFQDIPGRGEAYVSVAVAFRERYLRDVSAYAHCRIMLGCLRAYCPARIVIDGGEPMELPTGVAVVAVASLVPGRHRVEATPGRGAHFSAEATELTCAAGEVHYVGLRLKRDDYPSAFRPYPHSTATFEVSPQMPEAFRESPMLIWLNGQWLVEAEPGQ